VADNEAGASNPEKETQDNCRADDVAGDQRGDVAATPWHTMRHGLQAIFTEDGDSIHETNGGQGGVMDTGRHTTVDSGGAWPSHNAGNRTIWHSVR
jgi:hypothetical protein